MGCEIKRVSDVKGIARQHLESFKVRTLADLYLQVSVIGPRAPCSPPR